MGPIETLDMINASSGWGWGAALVVHTVDGAVRLVDVTPAGVDRAHPIVAATALDARHAWIIAPSTRRERFTLYRTQDGGATWSTSTIGTHQAGDITFVDPKHGWMQASRLIDNHRVNVVTLSRTLDGGASWSTIYRTRQRISIQPHVQTGDCQWSLVRFSTPRHGIVGLNCDKSGTPKIDTTDDGGKTWRRTALPAPRHPPGAALWSNVQRPLLDGSAGAVYVSLCVGDGVSCNEFGNLYRSADGGKTWFAGQEMIRAGDGTAIADPDHVWLPYACLTRCGSAPELLRTQDGGGHWTSIRLPAALAPNMHGSRQFQFVSPSVGFALTGQEFDPHTHFFRTTNGGQSFRAFQPRVVHR